MSTYRTKQKEYGGIGKERGGESREFSKGANIVSRCRHCRCGATSCGRSAGPSYHQARGFSCEGQEQLGSQRKVGHGVDLCEIKTMIPDWEWSVSMYRTKQKEYGGIGKVVN